MYSISHLELENTGAKVYLGIFDSESSIVDYFSKLGFTYDFVRKILVKGDLILKVKRIIMDTKVCLITTDTEKIVAIFDNMEELEASLIKYKFKLKNGKAVSRCGTKYSISTLPFNECIGV